MTTAGKLEKNDTSVWAKAATAAAISVAGILLIIKLMAWWLSGSVAVLGALVDSGLDLVSSGIAFAAVRIAAEPPDEKHRFGHQKAEAVSALMQTMLIAASATLVSIESFRRLINPVPLERTDVAVAALVISVALSIGLIGFQTLAYRRTGSLVLKADRAHYLGDVFSNAGVLAAVLIAAGTGFLRADAIAGLVAAGFLFWSVKEVAEAALPQLMDEELPEAEREEIIGLITSDPGVDGFHNLRTRQAGTRRFIQVDLEMAGSITLLEAHQVASRVSATLKAVFPGADVLVHQDIADDAGGHSKG